MTQEIPNLGLSSFEINTSIKKIGLSHKVFGNKNKKHQGII